MTSSQMAIAPLGAGDLIDRALRFYRQNFWTFILIAAPPIIIGTIISISWTFLGREIFSVSASQNRSEIFLYYIFNSIGTIVIWLTESVAVLSVMGGASRNFVRHLLFGESLSFRETYGNVRQRIGGLIAASLFITFFLGLVGFIIFYIGLFLAILAIFAISFAFKFSPFLTIVVSILTSSAIIFLTGWLFFLVASRFAYVQQAMLVEGQGVFGAISRSMSLASGNVKRFAAMFVFTIVATYSALSLFYIPLIWYAYLEGVPVFGFDQDLIPAWYQIAGQVIWQASLILLVPIWMIGSCLLYVDERVRHEGYDIELLAAQRLGEIPAVPKDFTNPLQPALGNHQPLPPKPNSSMTTLGLK